MILCENLFSPYNRRVKANSFPSNICTRPRHYPSTDKKPFVRWRIWLLFNLPTQFLQLLYLHRLCCAMILLLFDVNVSLERWTNPVESAALWTSLSMQSAQSKKHSHRKRLSSSTNDFSHNIYPANRSDAAFFPRLLLGAFPTKRLQTDFISRSSLFSFGTTAEFSRAKSKM